MEIGLNQSNEFCNLSSFNDNFFCSFIVEVVWSNEPIGDEKVDGIDDVLDKKPGTSKIDDNDASSYLVKNESFNKIRLRCWQRTCQRSCKKQGYINGACLGHQVTKKECYCLRNESGRYSGAAKKLF